MINADSIAAARRLLAAHIPQTRLVRAESLSGRVAAYLKLESELPTGSFKVRGAIYALSNRLRAGRPARVVASSTGNHGAAVAFAGRLFDVPVTIFLPAGSNPVKVERIASLGAMIDEGGAALADESDRARAFAQQSGIYFLDDATDPGVPVGTATIAAEALEQLPDASTFYVPVGDTALIRGIAAAAKMHRRTIRVVGVQADNAPAYYRSWQTGQVVTTDMANTMADGLATSRPADENVRAIRSLVDDMVLVTEEELLSAVRWLLFREHLVAEPSGAAAVAAFLKAPPSDGPNVLIVSGSNIAPDVLRQAAQLSR